MGGHSFDVLVNFDITSTISFIMGYVMLLWSWSFTFAGITVQIGMWFCMCLVFVLIVKVIDWLAGGNIFGTILSGISRGFKGD